MKRAPWFAWGLVALAAAVGCNNKYSRYPAVTGVDKLDNTPRPFEVTNAVIAVGRVTQDHAANSRPALAPNGSLLLYEELASDPKGVRYDLIGVEPNALVRRDVFSPPTVSARSPSFSQDGSVLVYVAETAGKRSLVRASSTAPSSELTVILKPEDAPDLDHPSVSPDGYRVVFELTRDKKRVLGVARLDGKELVVLGEGMSPAWSSDGTRIAFLRKVGPWAQVLVADATGGSTLLQLTRSAADHRDPAWSPDASTLVYASNVGWKRSGGTAEGTWNLFAIRADGTGKPVQLTKTKAAATTPTWGRDGWIYFASDALANQDIWRLKPGGDLAKAGVPLGGVALVPASKPHAPGLKPEFNTAQEDQGHQPMPVELPNTPENAPPPPAKDDSRE